MLQLKEFSSKDYESESDWIDEVNAFLIEFDNERKVSPCSAGDNTAGIVKLDVHYAMADFAIAGLNKSILIGYERA